MSAIEPTVPTGAPIRRRTARRYLIPVGTSVVIVLFTFALFNWIAIEYAYLATYTILQYVVLATAWNIFGGYAGYVNFGVAGFFALGVYASVVNYKTLQLPLPVIIVIAGVVAGIVGLGMGYLTLRLRGVFFSIATLAFSIVLNIDVHQLAFRRRRTRRLRAAARCACILRNLSALPFWRHARPCHRGRAHRARRRVFLARPGTCRHSRR